MEDVFPERVERGRRDHEAVYTHPEPVCESREGEGDDEVGEDGRDEYDEGFGGDEVEEEPHDPDNEGVGCGLKVGEPIRD